MASVRAVISVAAELQSDVLSVKKLKELMYNISLDVAKDTIPDEVDIDDLSVEDVTIVDEDK